MIILAAAAIFGAALGLFMRNALLAIVAAPFTLGVAQFGVITVAQGMAYKPDQADLAATLQSYAGAEPAAVIPTVVAALVGAGIAGFMTTLSRKQREEHDGDTFVSIAAGNVPGPRKRRSMKFSATLSERSVHADAASRFDRLLDR